MCHLGWRHELFRNLIPVTILKSTNMLRKVSTFLWPLVNVQLLLRYLYNCWVQPCIYGNNLSSKWTWLALSRNCKSGNYIVWPFIISIYLNLGLMSYYTQSYRKSLLSSQSLLLYCVLYNISELVGLVIMALTVC